MTQIQNKDLLNAIRAEQSAEYQERIPMATGSNDLEICAALENYPTTKNEFINTLTNKVAKTMFFNKVFNNPLKMLHRGMLPYGKSIEEMFVELAEQKGFNEHFEGSSSNEADLIGVTSPKVKVDYISQNFAYKFKTSISDLQLKGAFANTYGLNTLLNKIVDSLFSQVQVSEFEDMKDILINQTVKSTGGSTQGKGIIPMMYEDSTTKANALIPVGENPTGVELCKLIRTWANKLQFPSNKYNLAGVKTWSAKNELVLFITPEYQAEIDVNALAFAFNVSSADVQIRTIVVDTLGTTKSTGGQEIVCLLADKDLLQAWDTINTTNTFYNPDKLTTNYFAHKHGIMAGCKFAQAIAFVKGATIS